MNAIAFGSRVRVLEFSRGSWVPIKTGTVVRLTDIGARVYSQEDFEHGLSPHYAYQFAEWFPFASPLLRMEAA